VDDKRRIGSLMTVLPPLPPNLSHLKRVYQGVVLIAVADEPVDASICSKISAVIGKEVDFSVQEVPAVKPKTRAQFEDAKQYWPSTFHEDKALESMLSGTHLSEEEVKELTQLYTRVEEIEGALVYDSTRKKVVSEASGQWDKRSDPLAHPVMRCIKLLAEEQQRLDTNEGVKDQYLSTGFDVFLHSEPCTMCAMALIHCRVKRVFFSAPNPRLGAFMSRWRLQELRELNHHYQVFRVTESGA